MLVQIARTDYRSYVRALSQVTQDAYDEELAGEYMARASQELTTAYVQEFFSRAERIDLPPTPRDLDMPMLLVEHAGLPDVDPRGLRGRDGRPAGRNPHLGRTEAERQPGRLRRS